VTLVINTGGSSQIPIFSQLLAERFPAATISGEAENVLTGVVQGLAIWGHDLDDKLNRKALPVKRQLVRQAANGERATATKRQEASFYIVGLTSDGAIQAAPWSADESQQAQQADFWRQHSLTQALFCGRNTPLLLGTLWSKFLQTTAVALLDPDSGEVNLPRHLQPEAAIGDRYVLAAKWAELRSAQLILLVTQNGNARYFQRSFVEREMNSYSRWSLEKGLRPDTPVALLAVDKADEVVLASENGRIIRVQIGEMSSRGQRALKLKQPETIAALRCQSGLVDGVVVVSRSGQAATFSLAEIPLAPRLGGVGKQVLRGEKICGLLPLPTKGQALGLTSWGRLLDLDLACLAAPGSKGRVVDLEPEEELINCWTVRSVAESGY
jgi:DNA gyrase/topoisomerase IV subunit A